MGLAEFLMECSGTYFFKMGFHGTFWVFNGILWDLYTGFLMEFSGTYLVFNGFNGI